MPEQQEGHLTMRFLHCSILLMTLSLLLPGSPAAAPLPPEARDAAKAGLPSLLRAIANGDVAGYGFRDPGELPGVELGDPLVVALLKPGDVLAPRAGASLAQTLQVEQEWLFPVASRGRWCVLLTVAFFQGRWQAVDLGGSALAADLQAACREFPAARRADLMLVRSLQSGAVFLTDPAATDELLLPLPGTAHLLALPPRAGSSGAKALSLAEAANLLAPFVRRNLQMDAAGPLPGGER
jgi:hypothetical protein